MRTFGIEIEVIGVTRKAIAEAIASVVKGTVDHVDDLEDEGQSFERVILGNDMYWKIEDDESLSGPPELRAEIVSPVLDRGDVPIVLDVVKTVARVGARVDDSCGVHVHIGSGACNVEHLCKAVDLMIDLEPIVMQDTLGIKAERNQFSRLMDAAFIRRFKAKRPVTMEEFWELYYGAPLKGQLTRLDPARYRGLNLHSHAYRGTVEFRYFDGSLDPTRVEIYVKLAMAIADRAGFPE
jgi:hypothetical protein